MRLKNTYYKSEFIKKYWSCSNFYSSLYFNLKLIPYIFNESKLILNTSIYLFYFAQNEKI